MTLSTKAESSLADLHANTYIKQSSTIGRRTTTLRGTKSNSLCDSQLLVLGHAVRNFEAPR